MRMVLAFLVAAGAAFGFSVILATYNYPAWPPIVMAILVAILFGQTKTLGPHRIPLVTAYAALFSSAWLKSFGIPIRTGTGLKIFWTGFGLCLLVGIVAVIGTAIASRGQKGRSSAILWAGFALGLASLVALYSGNSGGSDPLFDWLAGHGFTGGRAEMMVIGIRKTIHFAFYGVLALSVYRASGHGFVSFGFAAIHAIFDELRQYLASTERTGSVLDVGVDLLGAFFFLALVGGFRRVEPKPEVPLRSDSG